MKKSKPKLLIDFQIYFLCIDPDQVDHLKVLRGSFQKIWEFHLAYHSVYLTWCVKHSKVKILGTPSKTSSLSGVTDVGFMLIYAIVCLQSQFEDCKFCIVEYQILPLCAI